MVFCLTDRDDPRTLVMQRAIAHPLPSGWTQKQRYVSFDVLTHSPSTIAEL